MRGYLNSGSAILTATFDLNDGQRCGMRVHRAEFGRRPERSVYAPDGHAVFVSGYISGSTSWDWGLVAYDAANGRELWSSNSTTLITRMHCAQSLSVRLVVFAKHVVHPERSEKNGVSTQLFSSEEASDEASS